MGDPHHTGLRGYLHLLGKWTFWIPFIVAERDSGFVKSVPALFYVYECSICMYTCTPEKGTRSRYRLCEPPMWLLGIELRYNDPNH